MWTYRCYDDGRTPNLWQRWYTAHPDYRGSHDAIFDTLEQMVEWKPPYVDFLNKNERIVEVRLRGRVKHRILGIYSNKRRAEFIVLGTCNHKGKVYEPPNIEKTVIERKG